MSYLLVYEGGDFKYTEVRPNELDWNALVAAFEIDISGMYSDQCSLVITDHGLSTPEIIEPELIALTEELTIDHEIMKDFQVRCDESRKKMKLEIANFILGH